MKTLLDTCVISELVAKRPNPGVVEFVDALDADNVYLSVLTIGEITKGIEKLPNSPRKTDLRGWLKDDLLVRFYDNIIPLDTDILVSWGEMTARLELQGKPMPAIDSLIAATALVGKMALVTRNVGDFAAAEIEIVNPWK